MITDFRLRVFIAVARTLSFTRAAATLNVSQPAISKHIKELEAEFGEGLFNRKGSSISLTPKGEDIIPLVENILEGYNTLCDSIADQSRATEGVLHIGASTTIAQYVLPSILAKFNAAYPSIRLSVVSANSDEVVKMLQRKEIEIGLIEGDNTVSSVHYAPFASDSILLVSKNSTSRPLSRERLTQIPLLIREEGSGTLSVILSALRAQGISRRSLNIRMQLGSSEAIVRYVQSSHDYAFVSILVAQDLISRGELFVNEVEGLNISRQFRFVTLHGQSRRVIEIFKDFCTDNYNF